MKYLVFSMSSLFEIGRFHDAEYQTTHSKEYDPWAHMYEEKHDRKRQSSHSKQTITTYCSTYPGHSVMGCICVTHSISVTHMFSHLRSY